MTENTPLYNLKVVVNEVGISPATLRAWERRYGLPKPHRSPGGHRLYSQQDIDMLRWLVERQKEGLSISRAVELWNRRKMGEPHLGEQVANMSEPVIDELRQRWLAACIHYDDQAANQILDQAFSIANPENVCLEVLLKGLSQVGQDWYAGEASVQQEHFASVIAARRVNALMAGVSTPTRPGRILAACPPEEVHDFVLLVISYLLRRRGWEVVYLGANVPLGDLDATIQATSPTLVISSAQTLTAAASLRRMSEAILARGVPLAFGGGIFGQMPAVIRSIPGHYLGESVREAVEAVERLVDSPPAVPVVKPLSSEYAQALAKFLQKQALVAEFVSSANQAINPAHLEIAIDNFTRLIAAALELGDIGYLAQPIRWLNGLLRHRQMPASLTNETIGLFSLAIDGYLGEDGAVIHDWLVRQKV